MAAKKRTRKKPIPKPKMVYATLIEDVDVHGIKFEVDCFERLKDLAEELGQKMFYCKDQDWIGILYQGGCIRYRRLSKEDKSQIEYDEYTEEK